MTFDLHNLYIKITTLQVPLKAASYVPSPLIVDGLVSVDHTKVGGADEHDITTFRTFPSVLTVFIVQ